MDIDIFFATVSLFYSCYRKATIGNADALYAVKSGGCGGEAGIIGGNNLSCSALHLE